MSLLLAPLREVSLDRHNRAVQDLKDGSLIVTLTFKTEAEIRALVKNGDGNQYGVTLTEHGAYCSALTRCIAEVSVSTQSRSVSHACRKPKL